MPPFVKHLVMRAADPDDPSTGFLVSRLSTLPKGIYITLGVAVLLLAFALLGAGARLLFVGTQLGRVRGSEEKRGWLRGGIGGVLFGMTLSALLAVSRLDSTPLERWGTLAILLLGSLPGGVAGGWWSWAGQASCAAMGGLSLGLLLIVSIRISAVTTRIALALVFIAIFLPLTFWRRTSRYALALASAFAVAYLLVIAFDLFVHIGFVDALALLVAQEGVASAGGTAEKPVVRLDTGAGKGLLAAWWIAAVVSGMWQSWWGLGTDGDDTWNAYLAQFITTHPSSPAGTHFPPLSLAARLRTIFRLNGRPGPGGASAAFTDLPTRRRYTPWEDEDGDEEDDDELASLDEKRRSSSSATLREHRRPHRSRTGRSGHETSDAWDSDVETLLGLSSLRSGSDPAKVRMSAKPAQYDGAAHLSENDDGDEEEHGMRLLERVKSAGALSGSTAVESLSRGSLTSALGNDKLPIAPERRLSADHAVPNPRGSADDARISSPPLSPAVQPSSSRGKRTVRSRVSDLVSHSLGRGGRRGPAAYKGVELAERVAPPTAREGAVPATPSLLLAIDRLRSAQRQARGAPLSPATSAVQADGPERGADEREDALRPERRPSMARERRASMDEWWAEVVKKSGEAR
ncbi:hypothetical protein Rhopal_005880-T1 [Rhodotorula paludigena]|uniref:TM7S3/TM198-like domain-containing protein n=1 Tax=Rhodotorula paludigena TaxID=86838 RepID=A0AAV5GUW9_9BASI|nr:hypothetical protein Rhopal_005880-T1 [Rhodotorula paludigena]